MHNRWGILAVLFVVRGTMAFQFQSVAAVAPLLGNQFGVSIADIGLLIGLYFAPGILLALPGGAIGQKFGDKQTALGALLLMLSGSLAMALATSWGVQICGRLVAGAGGVVLSVQLTKMLTDWFAGREIATAMAILVNSWPAGIAVSLLTLPVIGTRWGVDAVHLAVAAFTACGIALIALLYRAPIDHAAASTTAARLDRNTVLAVITAGLIWGLFNIGFAIIFSFGPSMLVERGWSIAAAGSAISIVLWIAVFSVPFGGFLADRTGRPQTILVAAALVCAMLMILLPRTSAVVLTVAALGLICGQPAGPIMSLPARVLQPATRAIGMGLFFTVFYAAMMLGPFVGGSLAKWTGTAATAFDFGAAMVLLCPLLLWMFNRMAAARTHTA
ncbi:CynX/NimT family MFS transporter [Bradyrhizobium sp. AUGA SZCCT0160]|uniref:MFS transporter n=1 Tax=Bradyrhizobium sp. AUGA SZCCT0160 TaxID=2807662 RepID=UPI001BAB1E15|nr:MFS transporter [Bradyrhizobium sp. AUGA SZCCT0160]MBR1192375.1 MFS transporter [Bradyrhizobium sp. AUGA SZCCT0160]